MQFSSLSDFDSFFFFFPSVILQAKAGFHVLQVSRKKQGLCFPSEVGNTLDEVAKETQLKEGWVEWGAMLSVDAHTRVKRSKA